MSRTEKASKPALSLAHIRPVHKQHININLRISRMQSHVCLGDGSLETG